MDSDIDNDIDSDTDISMDMGMGSGKPSAASIPDDDEHPSAVHPPHSRQ